ncbi:MAG TPA: hypothetical protein VEI97_10655, partial [bacterium]|nr:hypothetical protein [bacterium]
IVNTRGAGEGTYWAIVEARDEATGGVGLEDDLVTPFAVSGYSTYQLVQLTVGPPTGNAPVAVISEPCDNVTYFPAEEPIPLSGAGSMDAETPEAQLTFEWDLDWSGDPADFQPNREGRDITWTPELGTSGPRTIGLRVTDTEGLSGYASIDIKIADVPGGPFSNRVNITNSPDREEDIGRAQTGFDRDHVIVDAQGKVHVFSLTEFFDTEVTTYDPATGESEPSVKLYETQYLYSVPIVRMAPDGTIHLLYMAADRFDDNGYERPTMETRTYDPVARTASEAIVLAEWATPQPPVPATNIPHMQGISFDINSRGEMVAVYEEWWWTYNAGEFAPQYAHKMFYVRNPGTGWEAPREVPWTIFTAEVDSPEIGPMRSRPDIRATGDDLFHAIYVNNPEADEDGPLVLYHRTYDFTKDRWGEPMEAHNSGTKFSYKQLQLFPAANGDLVVLFQRSFNQIYYLHYGAAAMQWEGPHLMADPARTGGIAWHSIATAAVTDSGIVFVAFQALNPAPLPDLEELYYSWFPLTATAQEVLDAPKVPIEICFGAEGQREPQFGIDGARNRMYLIYENPEDVPENDLWVASKALP